MSSEQYWKQHKENGQRMVEYADSMMGRKPGEIGAVPLAMTTEIEACGSADYPDVPLELLGERPPYPLSDRHRRMEDDFNALVAIELERGTVTQDVADRARANFHDYTRASHLFPPNHYPQTSPRFYQ